LIFSFFLNSNLNFGTGCYRWVALPYPAVAAVTAVYHAVTTGKKTLVGRHDADEDEDGLGIRGRGCSAASPACAPYENPPRGCSAAGRSPVPPHARLHAEAHGSQSRRLQRRATRARQSRAARRAAPRWPPRAAPRDAAPRLHELPNAGRSWRKDWVGMSSRRWGSCGRRRFEGAAARTADLAAASSAST
jgi:hypothetical protein